MVKSPEEHFNCQEFSPLANPGEYTAAERLFMIKYLGIEVGKSGILEAPEAPPLPSALKDNAAEMRPNTAAVVTDAMFDLGNPAEEIKNLAANPMPPSGQEQPESAGLHELEFENAQAPQIFNADPGDPLAPELQGIQETPAAQATQAPAEAETLPATEPKLPEELTPTPELPTKLPGELETGVTSDSNVSPDQVPVLDPVQGPAQDPGPILSPRHLTAEEQSRKDFADVMANDPALETILKDEDFVQMVGFYIGDQEFVVSTMAMQEVIRFEPPIRIPLAPKFVEGVISLRGRVTPVVNLRDMLEVRNTPLQGDYCIIICQRRGMQLGFLVEKIHTLYRVPQKDIEWGVESHLGINSDVDFISAIMKSEDGTRLLGMLSVDKIIEFILK